MYYIMLPNTSNARAHCRHYWIFYVCGFLSLYRHGQACSHHSCLHGIQPLQVWAWMQTLSPLMQSLLLQSLTFFIHLPVTLPTVLSQSCQGPCHILVTWGTLVSPTPSSLISTLKFIFIYTHFTLLNLFSYVHSSQRTSQTFLFLCAFLQKSACLFPYAFQFLMVK